MGSGHQKSCVTRGVEVRLVKVTCSFGHELPINAGKPESIRPAAKFVLLAWVLAARAQPAPRTANLWIRLDEPGKQSASITLLRLPPEGLGEALADAVGCRATDLKRQGFPY
jgi:hypothetical protein